MPVVQIPNVGRVRFPDTMTDEEIKEAIRTSPAFKAAFQSEEDSREGVGPAARRGLEVLKSGFQTAFESATDDKDAAALAGLKRQEEIAKQFAPGSNLEAVIDAYKQEGFLPAAKEVVSQVPTAIAEQFPNIAGTVGASFVGGRTFGAPGAIAGGLSFALPQLYSSFLERQAEEDVAAGRDVDVDRGKALLAAAPAAGLELAATFTVLGRGVIGSLLGPKVERLLAEGGSKAIDEGIISSLAKGGARGLAVESGTEVAQQMIERYQAGLPLSTPDAVQEYGRAAYGAALVGTPLGGAGRYFEAGRDPAVDTPSQTPVVDEALVQRSDEAQPDTETSEIARYKQSLNANKEQLKKLKQLLKDKTLDKDIRSEATNRIDILEQQINSDTETLRAMGGLPSFEEVLEQQTKPVEEPTVKEPTVKEPTVEEPTVKEPTVAERMAEEPAAPVVEEDATREGLRKEVAFFVEDLESAGINTEAIDSSLRDTYDDLGRPDYNKQLKKLEELKDSTQKLRAVEAEKQIKDTRDLRNKLSTKFLKDFSTAQKIKDKKIKDAETESVLKNYFDEQTSGEFDYDILFPKAEPKRLPFDYTKRLASANKTINTMNREIEKRENQRKLFQETGRDKEAIFKLSDEISVLRGNRRKAMEAIADTAETSTTTAFENFNRDLKKGQLSNEVAKALGLKDLEKIRGKTQPVTAKTTPRQSVFIDAYDKNVKEAIRQRIKTLKFNQQRRELPGAESLINFKTGKLFKEKGNTAIKENVQLRILNELLATVQTSAPVRSDAARITEVEKILESNIAPSGKKLTEELKKSYQEELTNLKRDQPALDAGLEKTLTSVSRDAELGKKLRGDFPVDIVGAKAVTPQGIERERSAGDLSFTQFNELLNDLRTTTYLDSPNENRRVGASFTREGLIKKINTNRENFLNSLVDEVALRRKRDNIKLLTNNETTEVRNKVNEILDEIYNRQLASKEKVLVTLQPAQTRGTKLIAEAKTIYKDVRPLEQRPFGNPKQALEVLTESINQLKEEAATSRNVRQVFGLIGQTPKALQELQKKEDVKPVTKRRPSSDVPEGQLEFASFKQPEARNVKLGRLQKELKKVVDDRTDVARQILEIKPLTEFVELDKGFDQTFLVEALNKKTQPFIPTSPIGRVQAKLKAAEEQVNKPDIPQARINKLNKDIEKYTKQIKTFVEAELTKLDKKKFNIIKREVAIENQINNLSDVTKEEKEDAVREAKKLAVEQLKDRENKKNAETKKLLAERKEAKKVAAEKAEAAKVKAAPEELRKSLPGRKITPVTRQARTDIADELDPSGSSKIKQEVVQLSDDLAYRAALQRDKKGKSDFRKQADKDKAEKIKALKPELAKVEEEITNIEKELEAPKITKKLKANLEDKLDNKKTERGILKNNFQELTKSPVARFTIAEIKAVDNLSGMPDLLEATPELRKEKQEADTRINAIEKILESNVDTAGKKLTNKLKTQYKKELADIKKTQKALAFVSEDVGKGIDLFGNPEQSTVTPTTLSTTAISKLFVNPANVDKKIQAVEEKLISKKTELKQTKGEKNKQKRLDLNEEIESLENDLTDLAILSEAKDVQPKFNSLKKILKNRYAQANNLRSKLNLGAITRPEIEETIKEVIRLTKFTKDKTVGKNFKIVSENYAKKNIDLAFDLQTYLNTLDRIKFLNNNLQKAKRDELSNLGGILLDKPELPNVKNLRKRTVKPDEFRNPDFSINQQKTFTDKQAFDLLGTVGSFIEGKTFNRDGFDYRISESAASGELDVNAAVERLKTTKEKATAADINFNYYKTFDALPDNVKKDIQAKGLESYKNQIKGGVLPDGSVFIVVDNHSSMIDLEKTLAHELIGHYSVESVLGQNGMKKLLKQVENQYGNVYTLADKLNLQGLEHEAYALMGKNGSTDNAKMLMLKEIIAFTAEKKVDASFLQTAKRWLQELVGAIRAAFKKIGLLDANKMSTSDIFYLLKQAEANFNAGKPMAKVDARGDVSFRITPAKYNNDVPTELQGAAERIIDLGTPAAQRIKAENLGLAGRVKYFDRFGATEALIKKGAEKNIIDSVKAMDVMYFNRMSDQRNSFIAEVATSGPLSLKKVKRPDNKEERIIESTPGASLKQVAEALRGANIGNDKATEAQFTLYLLAKRAKRVGKKVLDLEGRITDAELAAAEQFGDSNKSFQNARKIYNEYNKGLIDFLISTGAMGKNIGEKLKLTNDYVPFYRSDGDSVMLNIQGEKPFRVGDLTSQPYLKELIGGQQKVFTVFDSALRNTNLLTDMALKNLATRNTAFVFKDLGVATISKGTGKADRSTIRFKINGEDFSAVVNTENKEMLFGDIPTELVVEGLHGIQASIPTAIRLLGMPANWLRKFVTRSPDYAVRQIYRDSMAAVMTTGANFTPVVDTLRELTRANRDGAFGSLQKRGVIGGQVLSGASDDMQKILLQITSGKSNWASSLAKLDSLAMKGDGATRVSMYNSFLQQGLSEREATFGALEAMNFSRRGLSPTMMHLNTLITFFNANIQGIDVIYRAFKGDMPASQRLKVKRKLYSRLIMMAAMTLSYTQMMEDEDLYKDATPAQRLSNWFIPIGGTALRVPIPFEVGFIGKALPEGVYNMAFSDRDASKTLKELYDMFLRSMPLVNPGAGLIPVPDLPTGVKPFIELATNYSFFTQAPIESPRMKTLIPSERYSSSTPEALKQAGQLTEVLGVSPIQIETLFRGFTGGLGISLLKLLNPVLEKDIIKPDGSIANAPFIGGLFQPDSAGGIVNGAYQTAIETDKIVKTYKKLIDEGRDKEAFKFYKDNEVDYLLGKAGAVFRKSAGEIQKEIRRVREDPELPKEQKERDLKDLKKLLKDYANYYQQSKKEPLAIDF